MTSPPCIYVHTPTLPILTLGNFNEAQTITTTTTTTKDDEKSDSRGFRACKYAGRALMDGAIGKSANSDG